MGILILVLLASCLACWAAGLGQAWNGKPKTSLAFGVVTIVFGALTAVAPLTLPREAFGELGHGDGMGLVGLHLIGAVGVVLGLLALCIAATIYLIGRNRRAEPVKE